MNEAVLFAADLSGADLSKAVLFRAINLTAKQLCEANKSDGAILNQDIKEETEECRKRPNELKN